jgi:hypothetical protein
MGDQAEGMGWCGRISLCASPEREGAKIELKHYPNQASNSIAMQSFLSPHGHQMSLRSLMCCYFTAVVVSLRCMAGAGSAWRRLHGRLELIWCCEVFKSLRGAENH